MFDKIRQAYQMKKILEGITAKEDYKGIKTTANGALQIVSIEISEAARASSDLEKNIRKSVNGALQNIQKKLQKEMKEGNIQMPSL